MLIFSYSNNSLNLLTIIFYFIVILYLYCLIVTNNNLFKVGYYLVKKKININVVLNQNWLIFFIFLFYYFMLIQFNFNYCDIFIKMLFLLIIFKMFIFIFLLNFFNSNYYSRTIQPIFFILSCFLIYLNLIHYGNFLFNFVTLELISILTFGFFSSIKINNYTTILMYLWNSIISALIIIYAIFTLNTSTISYLFVLLLKLYTLFKLGILPFGLWLFFFYKNINLSFLVYYFIYLYIVNIIAIILFINTFKSFVSIDLTNYVSNLFNFIIILSNFICFIFFFNNIDIRVLLVINTNITSIIVFCLLFN